MIPKKLLVELRKKRNKVFLVSSHVGLEGDALGAELAVASLLEALGKKAVIFNEDRPPAEYGFLPHRTAIRPPTQGFAYDAAVIVDCSDISRTGKVSQMIRKGKPLVNIDHHVSNTRFGTINWVVPGASCASEMVYRLFEALKVKIKKPDAICLYTGILADTGSFQYSTTSSLTHHVAGELLKHRIDAYRIHRFIYESMSFKTIKAFGRIIQTLKTDETGKIAWLVMRRSLICQEPALAEQTDAVIHFARAVRGVEIALLFKEIRRNKEVRLNLRSTGRADVNALAGVFGGGGHKMASGATLHGRLQDVIERVVAEAKKRIL